MKEKKLRFAVVGVGGIGAGHVGAVIASPYAELTAVCDILGDRALDKYEERGFAPIRHIPMFTDYYELLDSGLADAVIISSPDATHCPYTVAALRRGIDVMCEKPLTVTDEESALIMETVRKTGRKAFAGQICRFDAAFIKAKELLDSGAAGEVFCIESMYRHGCHKDLPKDDWRFFPPRHATACGGCHAIDIVRFLLGSDPDRVFAFGNRKCRTDWSVEDCSETVMHFPDDTIGRVFTTLGVIADYSMETVIYGTKGSIFTNYVADSVKLRTESGTEVFPVKGVTHNAVGEVDAMCRAILYGEPASHEIIEGAKTLLVCNAAIRSMKSGMPEKPEYELLG